tara:strand:+ start:4752 stop:5633 length:882 start_codon:yes stop_codon:yes gene_type:complete
MRYTQEISEVYGKFLQDSRTPKPTACGTQQRISSVGSCLRQRGFEALKFDETNPIDKKTLIAFDIGNAVHEGIQAACRKHFSGKYELPLDLTQRTGISLSGSCDGLIFLEDETQRLLEIKSTSSYGFKLARDGLPKMGHVAQAALYAIAADVDELWIVYVAKQDSFRDNIEVGETLEWVLTLDEEIPEWGISPRQIAELELGWFRSVQEDISIGALPAPYIPSDDGQLEFQEIASPFGKRTKGGAWQCRYCRFNRLCSFVGSGDVSLDTARWHSNNLKENDAPTIIATNETAQ